MLMSVCLYMSVCLFVSLVVWVPETLFIQAYFLNPLSAFA